MKIGIYMYFSMEKVCIICSLMPLQSSSSCLRSNARRIQLVFYKMKMRAVHEGSLYSIGFVVISVRAISYGAPHGEIR